MFDTSLKCPYNEGTLNFGKSGIAGITSAISLNNYCNRLLGRCAGGQNAGCFSGHSRTSLTDQGGHHVDGTASDEWRHRRWSDHGAVQFAYRRVQSAQPAGLSVLPERHGAGDGHNGRRSQAGAFAEADGKKRRLGHGQRLRTRRHRPDLSSTCWSCV